MQFWHSYSALFAVLDKIDVLTREKACAPAPAFPKPADRRPVAREARHACRATNPAGVRRRLGGAAARRRRGRSPSLGGQRLRASVTAVADGHALVIGGGGVSGIAWV